MRVLVTGARGMLGSSIATALRERDDVDLIALGRDDLDLSDRSATAQAIAGYAPDAIVHAAAAVGGIAAKLAHPTRFLMQNLLIDSSVLDGAVAASVSELLYISSAAIYPAETQQPISPNALLGGPLEKANEGYALAKIAGSTLCGYISQEYGFSYRSAVPSNLYGPNDDYTPGRSHLIASIVAKMADAQSAGAESVTAWGDGTARREFTYAPDLAAWLASQVGSLAAWPELVNIGTGIDYSIADYYRIAAETVGFTGEIIFDASKPSGVPQRLLDSSDARAIGWQASTSIEDGTAACFDAYRQSVAHRNTKDVLS